MATVALPPPRARTTSIPGGIRYVVPTRKNPFVLLFLPMWLVGWGFGEVFAIRQLVLASPAAHGPPSLFLAVWLTLWTAGGAAALVAWIWTAFGREVVEVAGDELRVRHEALGVGRTRAFAAREVRALRVSPAPFDPFSMAGSMRYWGMGGGKIAFDYGARTYRLAAGVDEAEAAQIAGALRARLPSGAAG